MSSFFTTIFTLGSATAALAEVTKKIPASNETAPAQRLTQEQVTEVIKAQSDTHGTVHGTIDVRSTLFLLLFPTIVVAVFKDGKVIFPRWILISMMIVSVVGFIAAAVSAYVSHGVLGAARTPEQIIAEAQEGNPLKAAANRQSVMEKITRRKGICANIASLMLVVTMILLCVGTIL